MKVGIINQVVLPLTAATAASPAVAAHGASPLPCALPGRDDVRSSFLSLLANSPERVLSRHLKPGFAGKFAELYPSRLELTALGQIAEECGVHGLSASEFFGFVINHRPSAESLVRFSNALMARSPLSRRFLIESIHRKKETGFYYGLVKDLEVHPAFDDFKNVADVELFHAIAARSSLPSEDLAIFDMLRTHGVAKIRRYYREGLKSIPPIRVIVDSHLLEWDRRFKGSALCALGGHPLYEEQPGTNISPNHVMMGLQWPIAVHDRGEPTIFEANLLVFFARQKMRPGWSDVMSAIVKIEREENEAKKERILNLLPDLTLDGSVDDFIASVKALAEGGDDAVFNFVEQKKGSIAELNRALDTALFFKQEGVIPDWNALAAAPEGVIENSYALRLQRHRERFPEKPIDQVRREFLSVTNGPAVPEEELDAALASYEKILALEKDLVAQSKDALIERITRAQGAAAPDAVELLALARDVARREFGIYPYNTQMLTAILLLASPERYQKGRVAQVATGEGKSLVFAMLAACVASCGGGVDLFTSNNYLARRDARTFAPFYRWFGLSTHAFRHRHGQVAESKGADVRYGPCAEFRWAEMIAAVEGKQLFDKPASIGLVDEVDNLLIDEGNTPAVISASIGAFLPAQIFEAVYGYALQVDDQNVPYDLTRLRNIVREIHAAHAVPEGPRSRNPRVVAHDKRNERFRRNIEALSDEALLFLVEQARKAQKLARNRDYVVVGDGPYDSHRRQIVIVDRENTGRIKGGHVWENGLQRFVELKEFGHCAEEDVTSFSSSAQVFYRSYKRLYALTGTVGDRVDRHELEKKYGLSGFTVPTHQPCRRVDHPLAIVATDAERDRMAARLYTHTTSRGGNGAPPALVMFGSIEEAMAHYDRKLSHVYMDGLQVVTGEFKQNERFYGNRLLSKIFPASEDLAVARAGRAGMLTIATPIFGRGTDIVLTDEAIAAGGLTSVQMFLPKNFRVEVQGRGRAGRQGKPGASFVIASLASDATLRRMSAVTEQLAEIYGPKWYKKPEALALFHLLRDAENVVELLDKDVRLALDERHHAYQSRYFDAMSRAKSGLEYVHRKGKPLNSGGRAIVLFGGKIFSQIKKANEVLTEANERWAHAFTLYNLLSEAVRAPDDLQPLSPPGGHYRRLFDEIAALATANGIDPHVLAQVRESFSERLGAEYAKSTFRRERCIALLDDIVGGALKEIDAMLGSA
jgi:preprotein translocase subunit SecA